MKKCVVEQLARSSFSRAAVGNEDEVRTARLLDAAKDVEGWLYNDRDVAYFIEYEWHGYTSRYYPDFVGLMNLIEQDPAHDWRKSLGQVEEVAVAASTSAEAAGAMVAEVDELATFKL